MILDRRSIVSLWIVFTTSEISLANFTGYPIILMHGDFGTQMEAKLNNRSHVPHLLCDKNTEDYYTIWLNFEDLTPIIVDCWADNIKLRFDPESKTTRDQEGVHIRIPGWGETEKIEWLSKPFMPYFNYFVTKALSWGYERGNNLIAAQYDFRKAPNEADNYFIKLKKLIETTWRSTGKPVVLLTHSMGGNYALYFLNTQTEGWKKKYIKSFISIAAPWAGSTKALKLFATGENLDLWKWILNPLSVRKAQRSFPSSAFMLPNANFWPNDDPLVVSTNKNYTIHDYQAFFNDIDFDDGFSMWNITKKLLPDLNAPNVEMHCVYGSGVSTPEQYVYKNSGSFPDQLPDEIMGDGDGTVNLASAKICLKWKLEQIQAVHDLEVTGVYHVPLIMFDPIIEYVKKVVLDGGKKPE